MKKSSRRSARKSQQHESAESKQDAGAPATLTSTTTNAPQNTPSRQSTVKTQIKTSPVMSLDEPVAGYPSNDMEISDRTKQRMVDEIHNVKDIDARWHEKWDNPLPLKRTSNMTDKKWHRTITDNYNTWYKETLEALEAKKKLYAELIRAWGQYTAEGLMQKTKGDDMIYNAEQRLANAVRDIILLKTRKHRLMGDLLDTTLRLEKMEMAYLDLLMQRQLEPEGVLDWFKIKDRDSASQSAFRESLSKRYESECQISTALWCPITRRYQTSDDMRAAHLVPHNTYEGNCAYIFGPPTSKDGHLNDVSNGLLMHKNLEKAMDKAAILIVPACEGDIDPETGEVVDFKEDKEPYKVRVLSLAGLRILHPESVGDCKLSDLDGRILEFKNELRPKKQYLWFVAITTIARRRRAKCPGWPSDLKVLGEAMWAGPGVWIRKSIMHTIMSSIGFVENPEAYLKLGPTMTGSGEGGPYDIRAKRAPTTKDMRKVKKARASSPDTAGATKDELERFLQLLNDMGLGEMVDKLTDKMAQSDQLKVDEFQDALAKKKTAYLARKRKVMELADGRQEKKSKSVR
ncbi:hypothetical protein J4E80_001558 [Alternaria sp. BMP 0032]|nr:hypothetical protein J4E80_001558 [Alternaria sp. BMP 0032]